MVAAQGMAVKIGKTQVAVNASRRLVISPANLFWKFRVRHEGAAQGYVVRRAVVRN